MAESTLEIVKNKINDVIKEGVENEFLSEDEYEAMNPSEKGPGKFYELFKVHKDHPPEGSS